MRMPRTPRPGGVDEFVMYILLGLIDDPLDVTGDVVYYLP